MKLLTSRESRWSPMLATIAQARTHMTPRMCDGSNNANSLQHTQTATLPFSALHRQQQQPTHMHCARSQPFTVMFRSASQAAWVRLALAQWVSRAAANSCTQPVFTANACQSAAHTSTHTLTQHSTSPFQQTAPTVARNVAIHALLRGAQQLVHSRRATA